MLNVKVSELLKSNIKILELLKSDCTKYKTSQDIVKSVYDDERFNTCENLDSLSLKLYEAKYCCVDEEECYYFCLSCRNNIEQIISMSQNMNYDDDFDLTLIDYNHGKVNFDQNNKTPMKISYTEIGRKQIPEYIFDDLRATGMYEEMAKWKKEQS